MKSVLTYGFAALCLIGLGAGAALYAPLPDPDRVEALGGTWSVPVENWHETDGVHRAQIVMVAKEIDLQDVPVKTVMAGICDGFVAARAGQVEGAIYRVDLNVLLPNGNLAYGKPVPIPVDGTACDTERFGDTFFPTYPGTLSDWFLAGSGMVQHNDVLLRQVTFQPQPGTEAKVADFDYDQACEAIRHDPLARRAVQRDNVVIPAIGAGALVIRASEAVEGGSYRDRIYQIAPEGCAVLQQ